MSNSSIQPSSADVERATHDWTMVCLFDASERAFKRSGPLPPEGEDIYVARELVTELVADSLEKRIDAARRFHALIERALFRVGARSETRRTTPDVGVSPFEFATISEMAEILRRCGSTIVACLGHTEEHLQSSARAILRVCEVAAIPALIQGMRDKNPHIRSECAAAAEEILGHHPTHRRIEVGREVSPDIFLDAMALVDHEDRGARQTAYWVLSQCTYSGDVAKDLVPRLVQMLEGSTKGVLGNLLRVLKRLGPSAHAAAAAVTRLLASHSQEVRSCAACVLGKIGVSEDNQVQELIRLLEDDWLDVAGEAAIALGRNAERCTIAIPALRTAFMRPGIEAVVAYALGQFGSQASAAAPELCRVLDGDEFVARHAAQALQKIGATAIPSLIESLEQGSVTMQSRAADALAGFGPAAEKALPALIDALKRHTHSRALRSIAAIGPFAGPAVPALIEIVANGRDRKGAVQALQKIGAPAVQALPCLASLLLNANEELRGCAASAIAEISPYLKGELVAPEDQKILDLFEEIKLSEWLETLQMFWCIGQLEREPLMQAGTACGFARTERRLRNLQKEGRLATLPVSQNFIRSALERLAALFNSPPFYPDAWTAEEHAPDFRVESFRGRRRESRWTPRARQAWIYIDRFLTVKGMLPKLEIRDSDVDTASVP